MSNNVDSFRGIYCLHSFSEKGEGAWGKGAGSLTFRY